MVDAAQVAAQVMTVMVTSINNKFLLERDVYVAAVHPKTKCHFHPILLMLGMEAF